jgi:thiol-disulfide isomerase/thioredoxin
VLLCFIIAMSACSSRQNSGAGEQTPAGRVAGSNQPENSSQVGSGNPAQVKSEGNSGLPVEALVFTYNANCCESTRQFFEQHRKAVQELENKYGRLVKFTWYDVAVEDKEEQKKLLEAAKKAGIKNIPAFVVLDQNGNVLLKQIGQLEINEVKKVFERLER